MSLDLRNCDCLDLMAEFPDKHFDLAIVDPPYGLRENGNNISRHFSQKKYIKKDWDNSPPEFEYFSLLWQKSKNQIIWGANHFIDNMPFGSSSPCWIFWDKDRFGDFADGELAWTSFSTAVRKFKYTWDGFRKQDPCIRIHPTEKPIQLYKWLLHNYAKPGQKILDTHLGSGSIAIACHYFGCDLTGSEIDKDYYDAMMKRVKEQTSQLTLI